MNQSPSDFSIPSRISLKNSLFDSTVNLTGARPEDPIAREPAGVSRLLDPGRRGRDHWCGRRRSGQSFTPKVRGKRRFEAKRLLWAAPLPL